MEEKLINHFRLEDVTEANRLTFFYKDNNTTMTCN